MGKVDMSGKIWLDVTAAAATSEKSGHITLCCDIITLAIAAAAAGREGDLLNWSSQLALRCQLSGVETAHLYTICRSQELLITIHIEVCTIWILVEAAALVFSASPIML